jgi:hypothetical protein
MSKTPRFSHSRDVSLLASSESAEVKDYAMGMLFLAVFILAVFILWSALLILFWWRGQERFGFLAGGSFLEESNTSNTSKHVNADSSDNSESQESAKLNLAAGAYKESNDNEAEDEALSKDSNLANNQDTSDLDDMSDKEYAKNSPNQSETGPERLSLSLPEEAPSENIVKDQADTYCHEAGDPRTHKVARICFMVAGVIYITFALLLATLGIMQLQPTVDVINETVLDVENISSMTRSTIDRELRGTIDSANVIRSRMVLEVSPGQFCPADPEARGSELAQDILSQSQNAITKLNELNDFSASSLDDAESALNTIDDGTSSVKKTTEDIDIAGWKIAMVTIPCIAIPGILMAGCILAWLGVERRFLQNAVTWFVFPALVLLTLTAVIAAVGMGIAATVNADFCLPGGSTNDPQTVILRVLEESDYQSGEYVYQMVEHFVSQCRDTVNPFADVEGVLLDLPSTQTALEELDVSLREENTLDVLALSCERDFTVLLDLTTSMQEVVQDMIKQLSQVLDTLSCEAVVPLYTKAVHEGSCDLSVSALTWIFVSALVMGVTGMIMITLRASYRTTEYVHSNDGTSRGSPELDTHSSWQGKIAATGNEGPNEVDELFEHQEPMFLDEVSETEYR